MGGFGPGGFIFGLNTGLGAEGFGSPGDSATGFGVSVGAGTAAAGGGVLLFWCSSSARFFSAISACDISANANV